MLLRIRGQKTKDEQLQEKYRNASYDERKRKSYDERAAYPSHSTCKRCGLPWAVVPNRSIQYGNGGCFAICEMCWDELGTAEKRIPYYLALLDSWLRWGVEDYDGEEHAMRATIIAEDLDPHERVAYLTQVKNSGRVPSALMPPMRKDLIFENEDEARAYVERLKNGEVSLAASQN